jgi:hypothetical protein
MTDAPLDRANARRQLVRQQQVKLVHRLGSRMIYELIDEIARYHGIGDDIDRRLTQYANLQQAVGADQFPHWPPLRAISGSRG